MAMLVAMVYGILPLRAATNAPSLRQSQTPSASPGFKKDFSELMSILRTTDKPQLSQAKLLYLIPKILAAGKTPVPYLKTRFLASGDPNEVIISGAYIIIYGTDTDQKWIRTDLETSKRKQHWLNQLVGSPRQINASIQEGASWQPVLQRIPATRIKSFARLCMKSEDPLVCRAGIYWGYWFGGAGYWKELQRLAEKSGDPMARTLAKTFYKAHTK